MQSSFKKRKANSSPRPKMRAMKFNLHKARDYSAEKASKKGKARVTYRKLDSNTKEKLKSRTNNSKDSKKQAFQGGVLDAVLAIPIWVKALVLGVLLLLIACLILYSPLQNFYKSFRNTQYREAVLVAYQDRNTQVAQDNQYLNTPDGIQDQARRELNYVGPGEIAVSITNLSNSTTTFSGVPNQVDETSISAPQTWYYNFFDSIFFVN